MGFGTANGVRNARFLFLLGVTAKQNRQTDRPRRARVHAPTCVSVKDSLYSMCGEAAMKESDLSW